MIAARVAATALAAASILGCGGSSAKILERIDGGAPPSSNLRMDVFLVRSVSSCAVGPACASPDPDQCFSVTDGAGARTTFDPGTVRFVPPGDPATAGAQPVQCFRLVMDDAGVASAGQLTDALRARVFQASAGDVNLEMRLHEVPAIEAGFSAFYTGLFLEPSALAAAALSQVNRETDFVFAITGAGDPAGASPRVGPCSGTNWLAQGVIGGSTYTWLALSGACAQEETFVGDWLIQAYFGLRDVMQSPNLYGGGYPACGQGDPDTTRWFPLVVDDCTSDPDFADCGAASCSDQAAFHTHLLAKHWRRGRPFNGNHCSDGRMDRDETGVDVGGVCDLIGR